MKGSQQRHGSNKEPSKAPPNYSGHSWNRSGVRWASLSGKEHSYGGHSHKLLPVSERLSSPEQEAEAIEDPGEEEAISKSSLSHSDSDDGLKRHKHLRASLHENHRTQKHRASSQGPRQTRHHPHVPACSSMAEKKDQDGDIEQGQVNKPTKVPLKLHIKVCSQMGSIGVSIAGGKGSSPYKENDEGIFISRVSKAGLAEKAGIHIGDRVLEVNGLNLQNVTHHEAVSALKNAGNCIKIVVLRDRLTSTENPKTTDPVAVETESVKEHSDNNNCKKHQTSCSDETRLGQKQTETKETVVCNGNGMGSSASEEDLTKSGCDTDAPPKNNSFRIVKHTMTIPRIILTHPSTSDEDVEQLTQDPEEEPEEQDSADCQSCPDCSNSAFYPP
ncbi:tyrosine-protein phosphatase non-receptor type 13 [Huso huso]|uniref:Tyrosine-protein phosphatase non-receptor type 13 n=1 Tax=Huso huso TaxID=61971 RepID=A0ABR0ZWF5_HUSHU